MTLPASTRILTPKSSDAARVSRSILLTELMAASASPRKPMVEMPPRSSAQEIFEVAWRRNAVGASSLDMPQPSSVTRINVTPPFLISTVIFFAPASTAFSTSSLMTDAGRSTTSPAAIMSASAGDSL